MITYDHFISMIIISNGCASCTHSSALSLHYWASYTVLLISLIITRHVT